jgi:archaellum biogenesis ATPase FlaH
MVSELIIVSIENLQTRVNKIIKSHEDKLGIYVCLNKTQKSIENILKEQKISTNKLFFIDCVTFEKTREDVLHISPDNLDKLKLAIFSAISDIQGDKFLVIDALSTFLIYNNKEKVSEFIKEVIEYATQNNVEVIALSPETKGEELLEKIESFFLRSNL